MADQEVIKHGKKLLNIFGKKEHPFLHKLSDLTVEVFIIVLAVSISIWFHNWNAHRHEQAQVKTFLLGLKKDIRADIEQVKGIVGVYKNYDSLYRYISKFETTRIPDKDSLKMVLSQMGSNAYLRSHKSRFTGFLSSGKIMSIEDDSLALNILNYYQETLTALEASEGGWLSAHRSLKAYMQDNVKSVDDDMAMFAVLVTPKAKFLTKTLIPWQQLFDRYNAVITSGEIIIKQIDELYPEEAAKTY